MDNSIQIYGNIMVTKNYNMFKLMKSNRNLNKKNYGKLVASMKKKQLVIPIVVNEKYEVCDGQHRLAACKELGLPVYFIVVHGYGIKEVILGNTSSSNWNKENFLHSCATEGVKEYIEFEKIKIKYDINISSIIKILSVVQGKPKNRIDADFENGDLTTDKIEKAIEFFDALEDFRFFTHYKTDRFIIAFCRLYFYEKYNHEKMKSRLSRYKNSFDKKTTVDDYLSMLCNKIYSYGATKDPIYYSAETRSFH